ncbi:hypothetical protein BH23CHL6_BH23CHL6_08690 [soil metagenome]
MVAFGALVRRCREGAGMSQRRVAAKSNISQSVISRFERGLAPGMTVERLVRISTAIGPNLPLGFCPHDHACGWSRHTGSAASPDVTGLSPYEAAVMRGRAILARGSDQTAARSAQDP